MTILKRSANEWREEKGIPVIPVQSEGFKGNKRAGYNAACKAMFRLIGTGDTSNVSPLSVNILGDFNLAGEIWIIREYFERMGLEVVANITGDGRVDDIRRAHGAGVERGAVLRLHNGSGQDDEGEIRHAVYAGFIFRSGRHGRVALQRGPLFADKDPEIMGRTADLVKSELTDFVSGPGKVPPRSFGQESGNLCRRRFQGFFFGEGIQASGDGCGAGRFSDRHGGRLPRTP